MKREIKFRVWNGVLHEYRTIDMNSGKQNLGMGFESAEGIGSNTTTIYHSFGDVIEQYTGLKDVNGKEIYEGDLVRLTYDLEDPIYKVIFDEAKFEISGGGVCYDLGEEFINCEVIGNVHDSHELLEDEK